MHSPCTVHGPPQTPFPAILTDEKWQTHAEKLRALPPLGHCMWCCGWWAGLGLVQAQSRMMPPAHDPWTRCPGQFSWPLSCHFAPQFIGPGFVSVKEDHRFACFCFFGESYCFTSDVIALTLSDSCPYTPRPRSARSSADSPASPPPASSPIPPSTQLMGLSPWPQPQLLAGAGRKMGVTAGRHWSAESAHQPRLGPKCWTSPPPTPTCIPRGACAGGAAIAQSSVL